MPNATPVFERVTIIGLGLIGSSLARGIKEHGIADIVVGCDDNANTLSLARARGMVDVSIGDPKIAVAESQLVILATPPSSLESISKQIAPGLARGAIVMDTASVKQPAMKAISEHLPAYVDFIPAHPIAGSEQSGIMAGHADLFVKKHIIITPRELPEGDALKKITRFWAALGGRVEGMPPEIHDSIYAYVSHLPHLLAFAAATSIATHGPAKFLRLSASDTSLWSEIFVLNAEFLLPALTRYLDVLAHIIAELEQAPEDTGSGGQNITPEMNAALFARIAASCLVTTVMEMEKKNGFGFMRFAGSGFVDFTSPLDAPPDEDIEKIAHHSRAVLPLLAGYKKKLSALYESIAGGDISHTRAALNLHE